MSKLIYASPFLAIALILGMAAPALAQSYACPGGQTPIPVQNQPQAQLSTVPVQPAPAPIVIQPPINSTDPILLKILEALQTIQTEIKVQQTTVVPPPLPPPSTNTTTPLPPPNPPGQGQGSSCPEQQSPGSQGSSCPEQGGGGPVNQYFYPPFGQGGFNGPFGGHNGGHGGHH